MDDDDRLAAISGLQTRMETVEGEIERLRTEQGKLRVDLNAAALESNNLCGQIEWIKDKLTDMSQRKLRTVDIILLAIGLAIGGISAFATVQNTQLTQVMVQIERGLVK